MVKNKEIWILEDDVNQQELLVDIFSLRYNIRTFNDLTTFEEAINMTTRMPDLVIADLILQDGHFFNLITDRESKSLNFPFIVVSGMDDIDALRHCYDGGAIDYMTKPTRKNELIAKVEHHINEIEKTQEMIEKNKVFDEINFDQLTVKEGKILKCLIDSNDHNAHRNELINYIWGDISVHHKTLDVHMYNLRRKLIEFNFKIKADGEGNFKLVLPEKVTVA